MKIPWLNICSLLSLLAVANELSFLIETAVELSFLKMAVYRETQHHN